MTERIALANLPTPLQPADRLSEAWGGPRIWIKRDDLTGFGLSGNKVRKIEYHAAAARSAGATTLITTGAVQSNHCRATAFAAAQLGFKCHLLLRTADGLKPKHALGNHLLHRLSGATIDYITPDQYLDRDTRMEAAATALRDSGEVGWVIPEGASDYLGMLGFAAAGHELAAQISELASPPAVWHASMSGGTTAGLALAAAEAEDTFTVIGTSVGDTKAQILARLETIWVEARRHRKLPDSLHAELVDAYIGGGYAVISDDELACQLEATRLTGLLFDPVYTGKAMFALREEIRSGGLDGFDDVVFWHTGGGFGVFAHDFSAVVT
ncbi:MAG: pyridoxal-phosphate dependent enzyme [bacterium]|nr:pyridoxal-phosphate dependent enzyme [bacterium]